MTWHFADYQLTHDFSALPFRYRELCQVVKFTPSLSGQQIRLRLTNRYGRHSLRFDQLLIADNDQFIHAEPVLASGQQGLVIPPGHILITDPLRTAIHCGQPLYIKMMAKRPQVYADFASTYHPGLTNAALSRHAEFQPPLTSQFKNRKGWFSLEALEVYTDYDVNTVELTGDSLIESGMMTTPLIEYFNCHHPNKISWLQSGISGNQLLHDAALDEPIYQTFGPALLKRFANKKMSTNLTVAVIGTNDLLMPFFSSSIDEQSVTTEDLLTGYRNLGRQCQRQGSRLLTTTIAPFRLFDLPNYQTSERKINQRRLIVNAGLRGQDGVVDAAQSLSDPISHQLLPRYDFGDHIHWNASGGRQVANLFIPKIERALF